MALKKFHLLPCFSSGITPPLAIKVFIVLLYKPHSDSLWSGQPISVTLLFLSLKIIWKRISAVISDLANGKYVPVI